MSRLLDALTRAYQEADTALDTLGTLEAHLTEYEGRTYPTPPLPVHDRKEDE